MRVLVGDRDLNALAFTGRFWARFWDFDCVLELHLDSAGRIAGSFSADGEALEVTGEVPDACGAVRGVIRARNLADLFARFHAQPVAAGAFLEVVMTNEGSTGLDRTDAALNHIVHFERLF
jgi:hypothetical protein